MIVDNKYAKCLIKKNEGLKLKPYKCTAGVLTIGYGYNLEQEFLPGVLVTLKSYYNTPDATQDDIIASMQNKGISHKIADYLFNISYMVAFGDCNQLFIEFNTLDKYRQAALIDMAFNLGYNRLSGFKNTIKAINCRDWNTAHKEMLDSKWAKQVPNRAVQNAYLIAAGKAT